MQAHADRVASLEAARARVDAAAPERSLPSQRHALEREFDVAPAQCQAEVLEHLEQLLSGKLVEVVNAATA